jgi:hypothetical protein
MANELLSSLTCPYSAAYWRNCAEASIPISRLKSFNWEMAISVPLAERAVWHFSQPGEPPEL